MEINIRSVGSLLIADIAKEALAKHSDKGRV